MRYRKKPVEIEAVQWNGHNYLEITQLTRGEFRAINDKLFIETLEGMMCANVGDYIIKGVKGELYPCKPDIFDQTYERVES